MGDKVWLIEERKGSESSFDGSWLHAERSITNALLPIQSPAGISETWHPAASLKQGNHVSSRRSHQPQAHLPQRRSPRSVKRGGALLSGMRTRALSNSAPVSKGSARALFGLDQL